VVPCLHRRGKFPSGKLGFIDGNLSRSYVLLCMAPLWLPGETTGKSGTISRS